MPSPPAPRKEAMVHRCSRMPAYPLFDSEEPAVATPGEAPGLRVPALAFGARLAGVGVHQHARSVGTRGSRQDVGGEHRPHHRQRQRLEEELAARPEHQREETLHDRPASPRSQCCAIWLAPSRMERVSGLPMPRGGDVLDLDGGVVDEHCRWRERGRRAS